MNIEYRRTATDEYTAHNGVQLSSFLESSAILRLDLFVVPSDGKRQPYAVATIQEQAGLFASMTVMDGIATADSFEVHKKEMAHTVEVLRQLKGPLYYTAARTPVTSKLSPSAACKTLGTLSLRSRALSTKADVQQFLKLFQLYANGT